jgi:three-Cys-motif partner protein
MAPNPPEQPHQFGGDWTSAKLKVLAAYLRAYTTALKDQPSADRPFRKGYIDAFAGTGYRETHHAAGAESQRLLFPDLAADEPQQLLEGSASLALRTDPSFDSYIFIERSPRRCAQLELLRTEFPELTDKIQIKQRDANEAILELCEADWRSHRAVLFLDPYGMQVEWRTIEAIAATRAIDLWLLFPLGIGVNRLLPRSGEVPAAWRKRLDLLLGTSDWYDEFYRIERTTTLFDEDHERVVKASTDSIGRYFVDRLKTIFAGVADEPGVLRNATSCPLYLFCFAVGNERGTPVALRIANHLLKDLK